MPRPQFSLKTMLWVMVCVAAAFAGQAWQRSVDREERRALKSNIRSLEASNETLEAVLDRYAPGGMEMTTLVIDPADDMPWSQLTLRALLVATLVVAAFLGGMALQRQLDLSAFSRARGPLPNDGRP